MKKEIIFLTFLPIVLFSCSLKNSMVYNERLISNVESNLISDSIKSFYTLSTDFISKLVADKDILFIVCNDSTYKILDSFLIQNTLNDNFLQQHYKAKEAKSYYIKGHKNLNIYNVLYYLKTKRRKDYKGVGKIGLIEVEKCVNVGEMGRNCDPSKIIIGYKM
jgi:hypothetical protein